MGQPPSRRAPTLTAFLCVLSCAAVTPARAAAPPGPDLFGGSSYMEPGAVKLYGAHASGSVPFGGRLRLAVDLSGHYGSLGDTKHSQLTFLAGPRIVFGGRTLRPFLHALAGGVRSRSAVDVFDVSISESDTRFGAALGGGLDYGVGDRWAVRAAGDYLLVRAGGQTDGEPRVSAGVVYRFGR